MTTESREAFEAWAKSSHMAMTMSEGTLEDCAVTLLAWNAWQASRKQALEELIAHFECKSCGYEAFGQQIADEIKEMK